MDEHRLGLHPILRRVWAPCGQRPEAVVRPRYQWLYVAGFVHPQSGRTSFWIVPRLTAEIFSQVLAAFAEEHGTGETKRILLVLDGAGWHTAGQVQLPPGLKLLFQPPYSPELQPSERLWSLCDEPLANRAFEELDVLQEVLERRCIELASQTDRIQHLTLYHWWPRHSHKATV